MKVLSSLVLMFALCALQAGAADFLGRSFILTDGRSDKTQPGPLVVAMHGYLGSPANMQRKTGLDALAAKEGLVVVYPSGLRRRWNDGRSSRHAADDVKYLQRLIRHLIAEGRVDPSRVFLSGHSNGGGMVMRMACDVPGLVAGIAVIATKALADYPCAGGAPTPAIFFHGTEDPIAPHEGRPQSSRLGGTLSSDQTLALWSRRNRCDRNARTRVVDNRDDGTRAEVRSYAGCRAGLIHVVIEGHGHDWPGKARATRLQGPATREIDATQVMWSFFSRL